MAGAEIMSLTAEIVAINRKERVVMTEAGDVCSIETFLDEDGDEVDDPNLAVVAVGQLPDMRWFSVDMTAFETVRTH